MKYTQQTDIHTKKAAEMFGVATIKVTPEQRKLAKLQNYIEWYSSPIAEIQLLNLTKSK